MRALRRLLIVTPAAIAFGAATVLVKMPARSFETAILGEGAGKIEVARMRMARIALDVAPDRAARMLSRSTGHDPAEVRAALELLAAGHRAAPDAAARVARADIRAGGARFVTTE